MLFPDCRVDDTYNEDFLNGKDHEFVRGFDWCTEMAVDNFFDNLQASLKDDGHLMHVLNEKLPEEYQDEETVELTFGERIENRKIETYKDLLRSNLLEWVEQERDELITSMIDSMDEKEFRALRNKVLKDNEKSDNPKEYFDSRKVRFTGKKECSGPDEEDEE